MEPTFGPQHLSQTLSELIALRGLARLRGSAQLDSVWKQVAGPVIATQTQVLGMKRGVLNLGVSNAPLLGELVSFHKESLLRSLQRERPELNIGDLKFRLKSSS